jgi:hypothetical protein
MTKAAKRIAREIEREAELADASIAALADEAEEVELAGLEAQAINEAQAIDEAQAAHAAA